MTAIEQMIKEHNYIKTLTKIIRKNCYSLVKGEKINYETFEHITELIKNYTDGLHHHKEELFLFKEMINHLGAVGEKTIRLGMMIEHDLGRVYLNQLISSIEKHKNGNEESILDIVGNSIGYTDLILRHIEKEESVIYKFAQRELSHEVMIKVDEMCNNYSLMNIQISEKYEKLIEKLSIS